MGLSCQGKIFLRDLKPFWYSTWVWWMEGRMDRNWPKFSTTLKPSIEWWKTCIYNIFL